MKTEDLTITESYIQEQFVIVLEEDAKLIGFFCFATEDQNTKLDFVYLSPKKIGQGYGHKLWEAILDEAKRLKISSFTIDSDPNAQGYYEKMGAKQIGETSSSVFSDRKLPLMEVVIE